MNYNPKDAVAEFIAASTHREVEITEETVRRLIDHRPFSRHHIDALRQSLGHKPFVAVPPRKVLVVGEGPIDHPAIDATAVTRHAHKDLDGLAVSVLGARVVFDTEAFRSWHNTSWSVRTMVSAYDDCLRPFAHLQPVGNDHQRMGKRERNKVHVPQHQAQVVNSNKSKKRKKRK